MEWLRDALCHGMHSHIWYPPMEALNHHNYYAVGKMVCFRCPVWKECLTEATYNGETWGMWGGLTPQERKGTARVMHGTIERYRLGCICRECEKASRRFTNNADLNKIPRHGEDFDIQELIFVLSDE